jgi:iron complex transport system ATP-binding protein
MTGLLDARGLALPGRLDATDLAIDKPQLVCLVGPNGSGKTSLLHALSGIGRAKGAVRIAGVELSRVAPSERRRLFGYLPASRDILWPLAARDVAGLGLDADPAAIDRAFEELELEAFADRRVDRLSTGERSRVLLARVLAARPRLLLLDEPVANLDPLWQLRLMDLLRAHARGEGQAAVVALHDLDLAARYADRLIVMQNGRIAADGDPRELVAGDVIPTVFGIERKEAGWCPVNPSAGRRSSR